MPSDTQPNSLYRLYVFLSVLLDALSQVVHNFVIELVFSFTGHYPITF